MKEFSEILAYDQEKLAGQLGKMRSETPGVICKGIPPSFSGNFNDIGNAGFYLGDNQLPLPVALLRESAIRHNRAWMTEYLQMAGINLAPHGKTSLSPELLQMQLEDGVWGLTAASAQQLGFFASLGIQRIILANQLVGAGNIDIVLNCALKHPALDFYLLADSRENVQQLIEAMERFPGVQPLKLLVEVGTIGGRTGFRDTHSALELARHINQSKGVLLAGIEIYEGIVAGTNQTERESAVSEMLGRMNEFATHCDSEGLWQCDEILLTAGGTEFFDLCTAGLAMFHGSRPHKIVIRSGCYITSDNIAYQRAFQRICERSPELVPLNLPAPEAALEVWAVIQSRPETELAFATLGKRDISHDWDMPLPLRWMRPGQMTAPALLPSGHQVLRLNDQHAWLHIPVDSPLAVGDLIGFGVSHACTTFDKWRCLLTVDDHYRVTGAVRTFF